MSRSSRRVASPKALLRVSGRIMPTESAGSIRPSSSRIAKTSAVIDFVIENTRCGSSRSTPVACHSATIRPSRDMRKLSVWLRARNQATVSSEPGRMALAMSSWLWTRWGSGRGASVPIRAEGTNSAALRNDHRLKGWRRQFSSVAAERGKPFFFSNSSSIAIVIPNSLANVLNQARFHPRKLHRSRFVEKT